MLQTDHWRRTGEAALRAARLPPPSAARARNLILFVGDGMGIATVTAARILAGEPATTDRFPEQNALSFEAFPHTALSRTYSADQQVSDSAPTMTAIVTGVKTRDGMLSVGPEVPRCSADPAAIEAHRLDSLLELAEDAGLATGIVTTARITHATPAALYAHTSNRDWEADDTAPPGVRDIALQLVEFARGDGIEVVLGGGRRSFWCAGEPGARGVRRAGCDAFRAWRERPQVQWAGDRGALLAATPADGRRRLLGLFNDSHMTWEADRAATAEPSLTEMTAKAIEFLGAAPRGWFLMVEAGRIDHGHHAGNARRALLEAAELSRAVQRAVELAGPDTMILVTADHSHVLTMAGYPRLGNPILGKVVEPGHADGDWARDLLGLPYTTLSYANGPGYPGASLRWAEFDGGDECAGRPARGGGAESVVQGAGPKSFPHLAQGARAGVRPDLSAVDTTAPDYLQESMSPHASETHGGEDVPVYATGPMAHLVHGVLEQHALFYIMREALGLAEPAAQ